MKSPQHHDPIDALGEAVELKELAKEDADELSVYLKRDLDDAADHLPETGHELKDWLGFETTLPEMPCNKFSSQYSQLRDL